MEADELFDHALSSLPEAVGDALREGRDTRELVFAGFDGASELGMALMASDLAGGLGAGGDEARDEVSRMVVAANHKGQELVVSMMVTRQVLSKILNASNVDASTRIAVSLWLETPLSAGHFRVIAIAGDQVRAGTVDGVSELDDAPESTSMLN